MTVGEDNLPDADSDPDLEVTQLQCLSPGCQEQGRHLLSEVLDVNGYLSFPLAGKVGGADVSLTMTPFGLRLLNGGPLPSGLTLKASNNATVEVTLGATPPGEPGPQYELSYTSGTFTGNPCVHGTAIAIDGDFDDIAHHDEGTVGVGASHRFSFACKDEGVAYKCVNFGYPPGSDPTLPPWKAHQVCTRAMRNDLCKKGKSYTLDQTNVRIWDDYAGLGFPEVSQPFQPLGQWPPPPDVFKFESVWPEDDKTPPLCLGKDRWQALEPGALESECGADAPADPRTVEGAEFCEEAGDDIIPENSMVLASRYTDVLLEKWQHVGGDVAVSVTGYYEGGSGYVIGKRPFNNAPGYTHVKTLGTLLRSLPGSIDKGEVISVFTYSAGSDTVLAGSAANTWTPSFPNGTTTWEGMVFVAQPDFPPTEELHAYETPSGEFYNGTEPADPLNDIDRGPIGYILVPAE